MFPSVFWNILWICKQASYAGSAILTLASEKFEEAGLKIAGSASLACQIVGLKKIR